jgi:RNA polymerase sigma factor (sigma-70 family)
MQTIKGNQKQLYDSIADQFDRLRTGIQVLVARSGVADGKNAINDVADDIMAMTLEKAIKIANRFDPSQNAYSWLLTIANNELRDYKKKVTREHRHSDLIFDMPDHQPQKQSQSGRQWSVLAEDEKLEQILQKSVDHLRLDEKLFGFEELLSLVGEDDRTILRLAYQNDLSGKGLATIMSITEAAALMRLSRARKRLLDSYHESLSMERET